jgi:hypothetical protein
MSKVYCKHTLFTTWVITELVHRLFNYDISDADIECNEKIIVSDVQIKNWKKRVVVL